MSLLPGEGDALGARERPRGGERDAIHRAFACFHCMSMRLEGLSDAFLKEKLDVSA